MSNQEIINKLAQNTETRRRSSEYNYYRIDHNQKLKDLIDDLSTQSDLE